MRHRAPLFLALALCLTTLAGLGPAGASASPPPEPAAATRGRAGLIGAGQLDRAKSLTSLAPVTREHTQALPQATCGSDWLSTTTLGDRVIVRAAVPGASRYDVRRLRNQGAWQVVATAVPAASGGWPTYVVDLTTTPRSYQTYSLTAYDSGGATIQTCVKDPFNLVYVDAFPDVIAASDRVVVAGLDSFEYVPVAGSEWITPAYSIDGRLLAMARIPSDTDPGAIVVHRARSMAPLYSIAPPAGEFIADPAFSWDGQMMAFSRYAADTGAPLGLGFVDVFGAHVVSLRTYDVPVVEPAWRPDGALVVSGFDEAGGLSVVTRSGATAAPIPGTAGGALPEVTRTGVLIWGSTFLEDDGFNFTSTLNRLVPGGSPTVLRTSSQFWYTEAEVSRSGLLFYQLDSPTNDRQQIFSSSVMAYQADADFQMQIGLSPIVGFDVRQPQSKGSSHVCGDRTDDVLARDSAGVLWCYPASNAGSALSTRVKIGSGWQIYRQIVASDLTSDDVTDLLGVDSTGGLWLYPGRVGGGFSSRISIGSGWSTFRLIAPGDWNGDQKADLLGIDSGGRMWLYPGAGTGRVGARTQIGSGWGGYSLVVGGQDPDSDGDADLLARDSSGVLWLYPGNGTGGFGSRQRLASGWGSMTGLVLTDLTNELTHLYGRTSGGTLRHYLLVGDGTYTDHNEPVGSGWSGFTLVL